MFGDRALVLKLSLTLVCLVFKSYIGIHVEIMFTLDVITKSSHSKKIGSPPCGTPFGHLIFTWAEVGTP